MSFVEYCEQDRLANLIVEPTVWRCQADPVADRDILEQPKERVSMAHRRW